MSIEEDYRQAASAALDAVPDLPRDEDGAVFSAPWEAKAFAMVVALHQAGHFEWRDWAQILGAEIARDRDEGGCTAYYELWLRAAERIVSERRIIVPSQLSQARDAIVAANADPHHHH